MLTRSTFVAEKLRDALYYLQNVTSRIESHTVVSRDVNEARHYEAETEA